MIESRGRVRGEGWAIVEEGVAIQVRAGRDVERRSTLRGPPEIAADAQGQMYRSACK